MMVDASAVPEMRDAMQGRALGESTLALALTALEQGLATMCMHVRTATAPELPARSLRLLPKRWLGWHTSTRRLLCRCVHVYTDRWCHLAGEVVVILAGRADTDGRTHMHTCLVVYVLQAHFTYTQHTCMAQQVPGTVDVVTAQDIRGQNDLTSGAGDELLMVCALRCMC